MAKIDIAVPCYNYARFLRDAVESIVTQSIRDVRVLIIDNGSTDGSDAVARQLAGEDGRVEVLSFAENIGPHGCYNAGLDWASSDFFLLLDADDLLTPGALERGLAVMEQNSAIAFSYSEELYWDTSTGAPWHFDENHMPPTWDVISGGQFIRERCRDPRNIVGAPTVLRRTSAQKQAGHFRPALPFTDDFEMWLRLATLGEVAKGDVQQAIRRVHGLQASEPFRAVPVRDFVERVAAVESFFAHEGRVLPGAAKLLSGAKDAIGLDAFWYGRGRHREGDFANAELCIAYAVKLCPLLVAPRIVKWLCSGEVSVKQARKYASALVKAPWGALSRRPVQLTPSAG
jgi:glycosyltransferase involved in cell wall biosynthesis